MEEALEQAKKDAESHWAWVETWLHLVYVDAYVHGFKHGVEFSAPSPR